MLCLIVRKKGGKNNKGKFNEEKVKQLLNYLSNAPKFEIGEKKRACRREQSKHKCVQRTSTGIILIINSVIILIEP